LLAVLSTAQSRYRSKLLSAGGSAAVLFNGIKESWRLARKILFLVLTVIREILTLLAILHMEIAKKHFLLPAALSNLTRPGFCLHTKSRYQPLKQSCLSQIMPFLLLM